MLQLELTKKGTGFEIFGDFNDLQALIDSCRHWRRKQLSPAFRIPLFNFVSVISQAKKGNRYQKDFIGPDGYFIYYGCKIDCVTLCFCVSLLKNSKHYLSLSKRNQSVLCLLSSLIYDAIAAIDIKTAARVIFWIDSLSPFYDDYDTLIFEQAFCNYIDGGGASKTRIKRLPKCLEMMYPQSLIYQSISERHRKEFKGMFKLNESLNKKTILNQPLLSW